MRIEFASIGWFALYALVGGFCWAAGSALFGGVLSLFSRRAPPP